MCMNMCICVQLPTEIRGVNSPGTGFTGSCKLPDVSSRNPIQVLCNSSTCS